MWVVSRYIFEKGLVQSSQLIVADLTSTFINRKINDMRDREFERIGLRFTLKMPYQISNQVTIEIGILVLFPLSLIVRKCLPSRVEQLDACLNSLSAW